MNLLLILLVSTAHAGGKLSTLHSFNGRDGAVPEATLVQGRDGALYGTTIAGGTNSLENGGFGTIFCLLTNGTFTTLAHLDQPTGSNPQSGLVQAGDGNFYGVTDYGGNGGAASGTVFRMSPAGAYTPLVAFVGALGSYPHGLTEGTNGALYGTTIYGGTNAGSKGTVFKVTTNGLLTTLVSFNGTNGAHPQAPLLRARDGNFYGTTVDGGTNGGWGTLFRLTSDGGFTSLLSFNGTNGAHPMSALVQDATGSIYGTCSGGGLGFANSPYTGLGTVYKFTPQGELSTLHSFSGYPDDGSRPAFGGLSSGPDGEFYGTTERGGGNGEGTIFALNTNGAYRLVYSFSPRAGDPATNFDGATPSAGLVLASDGKFYGVTMSGGEFGLGTIFRLGLVPDPLRIAIKQENDDMMELTWNALTGRDYQLQSNPGLGTTNWLNLGPSIKVTNTVVTAKVVVGQDQSVFFRVVLLP